MRNFPEYRCWNPRKMPARNFWRALDLKKLIIPADIILKKDCIVVNEGIKTIDCHQSSRTASRQSKQPHIKVHCYFPGMVKNGTSLKFTHIPSKSPYVSPMDFFKRQIVQMLTYNCSCTLESCSRGMG
ncbi:hypothetical protein X975_09522, partial [Stegodyphus mimosarum]